MINFNALKIKVLSTGPSLSSSMHHMMNSLVELCHQHYDIEDAHYFLNVFLRPTQKGEVFLYYREDQQLVGFTRVCVNTLRINEQSITLFDLMNFHHPAFDIKLASSRIGYTQALKYKLAHTTAELACFFSTSSPEERAFLADLSATELLAPMSDRPDHLTLLARKFKEAASWDVHSANPFIIDKFPEKKSQSGNAGELPALDPYQGLSLSADKGQGVLTYLPLDFKHISSGIRRMLAQRSPNCHSSLASV